MDRFFPVLSLLLWALAWSLGGILLAHSVFHLRRERFIVGLILGFTLELWISNWLAHGVPVTSAFWAGAGLVLTFGLAAFWPQRKQWRAVLSIPAGQALLLGFLVYLFFAIGRGLDIFDDFQNVPTVSIMAAGDIPPHFPFAPQLRYGYHYLLLLFAAQLTRLGDLFPWNALDLARALALAFFIQFTYVWARRMTRSSLAASLTALFAFFSGGARWLLLLLPPSLLQWISQNVTLIGSGEDTASSLAAALTSIWRIEGDGPIQFPFAFANGLNVPVSMAHNGVGAAPALLFLLLIFLSRRLRDWKSALLFAALFAAYALTVEYPFLILYPSLGLLLLAHWIQTRRLTIPRSLLPTLAAASAALIFAALQGGVLTEILRGLLIPSAEKETFHTFSFVLSPPTLVSSHLGFLNLLNPPQLIAGLAELGPILLALPLLWLWGRKMFRVQQWWEAGVMVSIALGFAPLFIKYQGTAGQSANARLFAMLIAPPAFYAVPLVWTWLKRRGAAVRAVVLGLALVSVMGGVVMFGIQLIAAQKPVLPLFIADLDIPMARRHWDRLPAGTQVFDPDPRRAVTLFGRGSDAMVAWTPKPEWVALLNNPDPYLLRAAGFEFVYFGIEYWEDLPPQQQAALQVACVQTLDEVRGIRSLQDQRKGFRRLLDISACR